MSRFIFVLILSFFLGFSSLATAQQKLLPKRIQAHYDVTKDGQLFARVTEQFVANGNTYKVESVAKGVGVYALFGKRQLTSEGALTKQGLKPKHFEMHQGDSAKKTLIADFDWATKTLHMLVKGEMRNATLSPGAQDLASYAYQFMFLPKPLKNTLVMAVTTGKKLNQHSYKIGEAQEDISIANNKYKTLHLTQFDENTPQTDTKELWLSVKYNYLPVRIMMVDSDGQKLEQTLTDIHVE